MKNIAIILAGGKGKRLEYDKPKQFLILAGLSSLEHSFLAFYNNSNINEIIVVYNFFYLKETTKLLKKYILKKVNLVSGGKSRSQSTFNALKYLLSNQTKNCNVIIHDSVRPLISNRIINDCILALSKFNAVNVCVPVTDTIISRDGNFIKNILNRDFLMNGQTPQGFKFSFLLKAYKNIKAKDQEKFTDDCGLFLHFYPNEKIYVIKGDSFNKKLTYIEDLPLLEKLFQLKRIRIKNNNNILSDKVIVIFGGTSSIGKIIVEKFLKTYSFSTKNKCDVSNILDVKKSLEEIFKKEGRIDFVINMAGIFFKKSIVNLSDKEINEMININYLGSINIIKCAHKYLKKTRGMLLLASSSSYNRGRKDYAIYSSLKAAIVNLVQGVSEEWIIDGIKINCICSIRVNTKMRRNVLSKEDQSQLLDPEEVSNSIIEIMKSNISGEIVDIRK